MQQSDLKLDLHFYGSLDSIRSLELEKCDIAGFHIPQGSIAKSLSPQYLNILNANNHQSDSRTRLLFDQPLKKDSISHNKIQGYQNEEFTYIAIAAMVAGDATDVGFGIALVPRNSI